MTVVSLEKREADAQLERTGRKYVEQQTDPVDRRIAQHIVNERGALIDALGSALGEIRAQIEAKFDRQIEALRDAPLDRKSTDRIVERAIDGARDFVRERLSDARKELVAMIDGELAARKAAVETAMSQVRREFKHIVGDAVLPLKHEIAAVKSCVVRSWSVDREAYTLTAIMGDGTRAVIDLRVLFEQYQQDTE